MWIHNQSSPTYTLYNTTAEVAETGPRFVSDLPPGARVGPRRPRVVDGALLPRPQVAPLAGGAEPHLARGRRRRRRPTPAAGPAARAASHRHVTAPRSGKRRRPPVLPRRRLPPAAPPVPVPRALPTGAGGAGRRSARAGGDAGNRVVRFRRAAQLRGRRDAVRVRRDQHDAAAGEAERTAARVLCERQLCRRADRGRARGARPLTPAQHDRRQLRRRPRLAARRTRRVVQAHELWVGDTSPVAAQRARSAGRDDGRAGRTRRPLPDGGRRGGGGTGPPALPEGLVRGPAVRGRRQLRPAALGAAWGVEIGGLFAVPAYGAVGEHVHGVHAAGRPLSLHRVAGVLRVADVGPGLGEGVPPRARGAVRSRDRPGGGGESSGAAGVRSGGGAACEAAEAGVARGTAAGTGRGHRRWWQTTHNDDRPPMMMTNWPYWWRTTHDDDKPPVLAGEHPHWW